MMLCSLCWRPQDLVVLYLTWRRCGRSLSPLKQLNAAREDHEGFEASTSSWNPLPGSFGVAPDSRLPGEGQGQVLGASSAFLGRSSGIVSLIGSCQLSALRNSLRADL